MFPEAPSSSVVGYYPLLMGSSTELSIIYTLLKTVKKMCENIRQKDAVVKFDLAMYAKAKQIQWSLCDEFKDEGSTLL